MFERTGQLWRLFVHSRWRRQVLIVFTVAFLLRFAYVWGAGRLGVTPPDYNEQVRIARYLLHGTGFVCPVGPERDDPSSWYVPGYIGLITASFWLFGEDSATSFAFVQVVNLLSQAGAIAVWVLIGRCLLGRHVAAIAGLFMVLSPVITYMEGGIWDTFPTMFGGSVCLGVFVLLRPRRVGAHFLAGGLCGLVAMINPCFSLCYPIWLAWSLARQTRAWREPAYATVRVAVALLGFLLVIAPWSIRNRVVFGEWFYLRGNMGLEMWVGNAPWSDGYFLSLDGRCIHPVFDDEETDRLVQRGEFGYFKDRADEVKEWLRTDTARVATLSGKRVVWFWFGHFPSGLSSTRQWIKLVGMTLPGVLALGGMLCCLWRRRACWVLVLTLVVFPVPYYLSIMLPRYRLPVEPLLLLMCALFVVEAWTIWLCLRTRRSVAPRT